ncbi:hypothetical protein [Streptomyces sp. NPDC060184]|uniref:hypothetical protein n=1 Tax=Streptomyces sp. NPDC060184 TaxID=3347064 RepID=UPI003660CE82
MSSDSSGRERGNAGAAPRTPLFLPLVRSWVAGALVLVAAGFMVGRALEVTLGTPERLESFGWRLGLRHVPSLAVTALAVLAAARLLPERLRASRMLYPLGCLAVPLAGLGHGYAVSWGWDLADIEGLLMPAASLVTGAAAAIAVDRLLEERATAPVPPSAYSSAYDRRHHGGGRTGGHDWRARGDR